jgi:hypothetical protein
MAGNEGRDAQVETGELADLSDAEREALLEYHPIREREYILPTPMMERAYSIIRDRVWTRRTGSVFFASPRMGKTRCALATKDLLLEEFPKLFVSLLTSRPSTRASDAHMYRLILEAERHALSGRANADALFDSAVADVEVKTKSRAGGQFVLLIDEIHLLNDLDLQQLVCFHNALELRKIKMTTISFAQPEIEHRRTALLASNDRQIIARFLSELVPYDGCTNSADLRRILRSYDLSSEFPEGSGWSYTRFFAPIAFAHGFRLEQYAVSLWAELTRAAGVGGNGMIPMEHTCLAIEHLLLVMRKQDCSNLVLAKDDIEAAVESSQLQTFNSLMVEEV